MDVYERFDVELLHEPGGQVVVRVRGVLDLVTAPRVHDALLSAARQSSDVVVDLAHVEFMDIMCARMVVAAHHRIVGRAGDLTIIDAAPSVRRVLRLVDPDVLLT